MKKALIAIFIAATATTAWAACTTHTFFKDGKIITCTTCCNAGHCTTTCF